MNTLYNDFHNTEARTRLSNADLQDLENRLYSGTASEADKATRRRLHNALCGSSECTCGGTFGQRPGSQIDTD